MYKLLAYVGWAWFAVAGAYLLFRLRPRKSCEVTVSSTEAVEKHEHE
jgi:hypothetical protein